jgi:hypothetical protein
MGGWSCGGRSLCHLNTFKLIGDPGFVKVSATGHQGLWRWQEGDRQGE